MVVQGSPTPDDQRKETYRHSLAVTAWRPGLGGTPYLYTLNLACPEREWADMQPVFAATVDSFELLTPSRRYVAPDKDPWLFF